MHNDELPNIHPPVRSWNASDVLCRERATMAKMTPIVRGDRLIFQQGEDEQGLLVETPAWYAWLETASTFAFSSDTGTFTARKERAGNKRGGWYWKAYRTQQGKLSSLYLGKSEILSLERLNTVAQALAHAPIEDAAGEVDVDMASPPTEEVKRHFTTTTHGDPLLATKLRIPRPPTHLVSRSHLTERLQRGMERPLTLIAAPAGFGKTTLLSAWLAHAPLPVAWVSLDHGDDDPTRFWAYTLTALERIFPGSGAAALALLQALQPPPLETILTILINQLTALSKALVLVWDDYQLISAPAIHTSVTFLVDHLPPCLHLVLATRADPPLPLARLRVRGHLTELRASDLRFTPEEAAAFLTQGMGLTLSAEEISTLSTRTEGWIAGLQLAALSLQGRTDIPGFIQAFTGSHRHVVDYLVQEVLARQPEPVQTFLLETAVLERMTSSLCEAVTGKPEGEAMLERLEQANLFLVPLDDERQWYRYHHLFADVLRQRLQHRRPDLVPELHRRASAWYERHGLMYEAVHHALAAADFERAAHLVEQIGGPILRRGEVATLEGWLVALPDALVRTRPPLCLLHAEVLVAAGHLDASEARLHDAERGLGTGTEGGTRASTGSSVHPRQTEERTEREGLLGEVAAIRALIAALRRDIPRIIALSRQALLLLPSDNLVLRGLAAHAQGHGHRWSGDLQAASHAYAQASTLSQEGGSLYVALIALGSLVRMQIAQGFLHEAAELCRQRLHSLSERGWGLLPATGYLHVAMAQVLGEWDELDEAARQVSEGLELGKQGGLADLVWHAYLRLAGIRQARGDAEGALDAIEQAEQVARTIGVPQVIAGTAADKAWLWVRQGNLAAAVHWAQQSGLSVEDELSPLREFEHITLARVLLAQGKLDEALGLLDRLLPLAEAAGRMESVLELLVSQAVALQAQGKTVQTLMPLAHALSLAEPEGYVRLFVDEGEPMAVLLSQVFKAQQKGHLAALQSVSPEYIRKLLVAFVPPAVDRVPSAREREQLAEPLSERELEVLRLLAAGRSNQEIAEALVVAVGTVKTHIHHIYGKLNASSRVQAVARARELQLLS